MSFSQQNLFKPLLSNEDVSLDNCGSMSVDIKQCDEHQSPERLTMREVRKSTQDSLNILKKLHNPIFLDMNKDSLAITSGISGVCCTTIGLMMCCLQPHQFSIIYALIMAGLPISGGGITSHRILKKHEEKSLKNYLSSLPNETQNEYLNTLQRTAEVLEIENFESLFTSPIKDMYASILTALDQYEDAAHAKKCKIALLSIFHKPARRQLNSGSQNNVSPLLSSKIIDKQTAKLIFRIAGI